MRKFLIGIFALLMCLGLNVQAQAATSDTVAIKVTIISSLSVDISETELDLGSLNVGGTTASVSGVTVTNSGSGVAETYSLSLSNPTGWTASQTAAGSEIYVLNAAFDGDGTLSWDVANHALSTTPVVSSVTIFAGDQTGVGVSYNGTRKLWFQFRAPTATNVTTEQIITVTVTAQAA